jgi:hypothetical protein
MLESHVFFPIVSLYSIIPLSITVLSPTDQHPVLWQILECHKTVTCDICLLLAEFAT